MLESRFPASFIDLQTSDHHKSKKKSRKILQQNNKGDKSAQKKYEVSQEFTDLGIPDFLQNSYLTGQPPPRITSLRPWQRDLISRPEWREQKRSAIILVPTSGGKTLAADVAIAQQLESDPNSKIIYALPFVSLASEKTTEFRARFPEYHVRPFYQNIGGPDFRRGHIAICTYEKVHSLLNCAIKDNYITQFKLVIIDEIHMIGENQRGAVIEAMIVKLLLLRPHVDIRIIGLTATLNQQDANRLSNWINGFIYICATRPSRIKHYYKSKDGQLYLMDKGKLKNIMTIKSIPEDSRHILNPIRNSLKQHPSSTILVFVNTRRQTIQVAEFIAKFMFAESPDLPPIKQPDKRMTAEREFLIQRLSRTETGLDPHLGFCVKQGVAFHHAGMLLEERKMIEDAGRDSVISVIVATTTLSAGINIRSVSRVIIYDIYRVESNKKRTLIPTTVYTQMAGRAGRDESQGGDVFILSQFGDEKEKNDSLRLSLQCIEDMQPQLLADGVSDRFFLQCLVSGLISPNGGANLFVKTCLQSCILKDKKKNKMIAEQIKDRLRKDSLIESQINESFNDSIRNEEEEEECNDDDDDDDLLKPTALGCAIAGSSMSIDEGLELKTAIDKLQKNLCLKDEVHLLYLCVPPNAIQLQTTPNYENEIWRQLYSEHKEVLKLITSLDSSSFERHLILTMRNGGKRMNRPSSDKMAIIDRELDRFFYACLLQRLIAEQSVNEIVDYFGVTRGSVQSLQMQAATFAGQSVRFCETTGCRTLGKALDTFRERLNFGVKNELLPLMKLPSCNRFTARILVTNRIPTPIELSELNEEEIALILAAKRGSDTPNDKEKELGWKLKEESRQIARSLMIIDELENNAFAKNMKRKNSKI
ncbi:putative ATP-dependent RNA helicase ddx60 [Tritrichomonas musculus]|uniref:ATP-dependent RNA helicase ddx60 n=1 Tax=Tritrichomonas musculus TaxID=1915356 RepID=A0ABR2JEM7_9EUKA